MICRNQGTQRRTSQTWWTENYPQKIIINLKKLGCQKSLQIKAPCYWSLWGEFTGDRWLPHKGSVTRKTFFVSWRHHVSSAVTITGGAYQGFLLQARNAAGTPVGRFPSAPVNTKSISCTSADSSMTHANTVAKNGFTYTWNPPSDNQGNVYFR